jgi:hypothetical protein
MRDRVLQAARDAGRDPDEITCVYNLQVLMGDDPDERPHVVSGAADIVAERLIGFARLGFTAVNFMPVGPDGAEQAELLARDVMPAVRSA